MTDAAATVGDWIAAAARRLAAAGVDRARGEARALLALALEQEAATLFARPQAPLEADEATAADALLCRRAAGEPFGRIAGRREFWSLEFGLGPDVLEPRPDTEAVVQAALDRLPATGPARVLDLGVGSGCILLAILSERPDATGVGVDRVAGAVHVARANARGLGLAARARFLVGDWATALAGGGFDLVVSNPPYVAEDPAAGPGADNRPDPATLAHDPGLALWGGADGLDAYRAILPDLARLLRPGGAAAIEVGAGQAEAVEALGRAAGLRAVGRVADLAGRPRCIAFEIAEKLGEGVE